MKLEEVAGMIPVAVERTGEFKSLGFIIHTSPQMLVYLEHRKYLSRVRRNSCISCIITNSELADCLPLQYGIAIAEDPRSVFYGLHNILATKTQFYWADFASEISTDCKIDPDAYIAGRNVRIGSGSVVEAGVKVLERSLIGEDVILRAGCTIGSEGFQFFRKDGRMASVVHAGGVRLGNRVEIQANTAISRAMFSGYTEVGEDTKVDNLVHVAHNAKIGRRCLVAASAMIAGSVTIGDDVWIGPGACVSSEVTLGNGASVTIGSVVVRNVCAGQRVTGNFAIQHEKFIGQLRASLGRETEQSRSQGSGDRS